MKTHDLTQGSPEWLAYRAQHFNASDAPAMMGCSPYKTRAQLLREMHTGNVPEVDTATHMRFANGHRAEALARPMAEQIIGEELYPVVGSEGRLSASFDGLTLDESQGFEHKAMSAELRAAFDAMGKGYSGGEPDLIDCRLLPLHHRIQMEQQLHVSGAERILFMASEWAQDGTLIEERHCWYYPDEELRAQILRGWEQFARDLAAYVLPAAEEAAPVGKAPDTLPALRIEVTGAVTASNLAEFKATALGAIRSVNRNLRTDQDFADAEKALKWCADVESRLKAAKEHALSQTADIDALFKALDDIGAEARSVRLDLDKLVTRRKGEVKDEAIAKARAALDAHIATLNAEIAPFRLPQIAADFAGCIKGLKSVASMQDKLDGLLATAKIAGEADARAIRANVATFKAEAGDYEFLFVDLGQLIHQPADSFKALVQGRIAQHKVAEAERERKKREAEELALQQAEARRLAAEAEAAAQIRAAQEAASRAADVAAVAAAQPVNVSGPLDMAPKPAEGLAFDSRGVLSPIQAPRADEPATLKLGDINERLAPLQISAAGLVILGIHPAATQGTSKLYRPSDYDRVLRALAKHIDNLQAVPA